MNKMMPVNFRAFLVTAICIALSVACAYAYIAIRALGIALICVMLLCILSFALVFAVKLVRGKSKLRVVIALYLSLALSISSFAVAAVYSDGWNKNAQFGGYRNVSGRVCAIVTNSGDYRIDLEDLAIDGRSAKGILRVKITASDHNIAEIAKVGDKLSFDAYLSAVKLCENGKVNGTAYRTNIRFYANIRSENIKMTFGKPNVIERFLAALRSLLTKNMGEHYGSIAFSMLTGDKDGLDYSITEYYSAAGLGHIMAVSGLHIGFLTVLLNLAMCKIDKRVRFPIVLSVLIAYAVLADFSPSVVRAVIMSAIAMISLFTGGRRDILSSLLCSFSVILAVKPFYIFEVGFILSFGAIFGIAMFSNSIARTLIKHGAHNKVANSISSALSVQAGIIPAQIYFFHKIQILAVLVNIVLIPYVSVVFISVICCSVIGAIPHCGSVLYLCKYLLMPLDTIANAISFVPYSEITVYSTSAIFMCYAVMFVASQYFMMHKGKTAVALYSAAFYIALCLIGMPKADGVLTVPASGRNESILCDNGAVYVVGYADDEYALRRSLVNNKCRRVDGIYLFSIDGDTVDNIIKLSRNFEIAAVYCYEYNDCAMLLIDNDIDFYMYNDSLPLRPFYRNGKQQGYIYNNILFAADGSYSPLFAMFDVVRVRSLDDTDTIYENTTYLCNQSDGEHDNVYTVKNGDYAYSL